MNSSKTRRLTQDGRMKMEPVFLNGGDEIVYTLQESVTQMSLMTLKLADGSSERLHPQATASEFEVTFSADGRFYAFVQSKGNLSLKLAIRDTKLNKDYGFDPGGGFAGMRRPAFTPDGSRVVFSIPGQNGQQLESVNNVGQDRQPLTSSSMNSWPAVSPNGKHIAFGSSRSGSYELYVMAADGTNARRLTKTSRMNMRPAWSPDSQQIAFTSNRDGNYEIYVMKADGSQLRRVTDNAERDDYATWHPDGKQLAFMGERSGKFDLYLIDVSE